jgi:hypothetical protein
MICLVALGKPTSSASHTPWFNTSLPKPRIGRYRRDSPGAVLYPVENYMSMIISAFPKHI